MTNFKKIAALICSLSIMATVAGCGNKDDKTAGESTSETNATEADTEEASATSSESATEESVLDDEEESVTEDAENDDNSDSSASSELDTDGTLGSMSYKFSSDWNASGSGDQLTYTLSDYSGAVIVQRYDAASMGSDLSEDEMIELLADQSENAWAALEGMEVVSSEWVEDVIIGKKCYAVTYTYEVAGITTTNISYFFANYNDSSKDLFAITGSDLTGSSNINEIANEVMSSVSFK
jgi:hypothetical protein